MEVAVLGPPPSRVRGKLNFAANLFTPIVLWRDRVPAIPSTLCRSVLARKYDPWLTHKCTVRQYNKKPTKCELTLEVEACKTSQTEIRNPMT